MQRLKVIVLLMLLGAAALPSLQAQTIESFTFTTNRVVPDGDLSGLADVETVNSAIGNISSLAVRLKITGEFNGNLYVYLRNTNGFVVLLNRVGKTASNPYGYDDSCFAVPFQVGASNGDIHVYQNVTTPAPGSPLTGIWDVDGRNVDPMNVTDLSARSTSLTNFNGFNAAGQWTLFVADVVSGGTNMLTEWGLDISGAASPALTWTNPADIVYGTALSGTQLNATATCNSTNVAGTFTYTPPVGTVLNAGLAQTLSVAFTPTDTTSFRPSSTNVAINLQQAPLTIIANDSNKLYGAALPTLTASYSGFVSGDTPASLSTPVTLSTTATAYSPVGTYLITASGVAASNYTITEINGTLTIYSSSQPLVFTAISKAVVTPDGSLGIRLQAWDANGDQLTFGLDPGAPYGAFITNYPSRVLARLSTNGPPGATNMVLRWTPTRAYASTTNLITVWVADNGAPPLSATQTFMVIVEDYLEITLGSTNLEAGQNIGVPLSVERGQNVGVPIYLASSDGVTNLGFTLQWPAGYLTNATLAAIAPAIASSSLQDQVTNHLITVQTLPGQALRGTQQIAQLTFLAVSNENSAFAQLPVGNAAALKPGGSAYTNYITHDGVVAVVENQSLLLPTVSANQQRTLYLFGNLGANYQLQYSTTLATPIVWYPWLNYTQTNGVITLELDSTNPVIFYRLLQH